MLAAVFEADARPRWPWVSAALAAVWLAVWAASVAGQTPSPERFGLRSDGVPWPGGLTFFALHASAAHLAVALAWLALSGPALEERWGHAFFASFLAAALATGAMATLRLEAGLSRPLVGASAALAALLGAAVVRLWGSGLRLRIGFGRRLSFDLWLPTLALPVAWLAGAVGVRAADGTSGATAGLDVRSQLVLAACGALCAAGIRATRLEERWLRARRSSAREKTIAGLLSRARDEIEAERPDGAYTLLDDALRELPDPRLVNALIEAGSRCGRRSDALACGTRAVHDAWRDGHPDLASAIWLPLVRTEPDLHLDMRLRLALAPMLKASGLPREAALTLRGELRRNRQPVSPGAALRIADAARSLHPPTALEAARLALESEALDAGKRARIEALIDALEADPNQLVAAELDGERPPAPPRRRACEASPAEATPADPRALALPEEAHSLDLADPQRSHAEPEVHDPRALSLEEEAPEADEAKPDAGAR